MRLTAASSPHLKSSDDVRVMMGDVIILMLPLLAAAVFYYGWRTLVLTLISVASCLVFETLYRRLMGKPDSVGDFSAVITGFFIAFSLPVTAPVWIPVVGALFAVVVVKQLFGGIGKNIFNPAAAGICMLTVTWPKIMSTFSLPFASLPLFGTPGQFETGRSTLETLKEHILPDNLISEMILGNRPGYFGTVFAIGIAIAGLYLLYRRIISWRIPLAFLGTIALFALIFPRSPSGRLDSVIYELTSGSVLFISIFMATDPVTSPVTSFGRFAYGVLCGILTVFLRYFGNYPEGAYFAILLANPFVLAFDRLGWKLKVKGGKILYAKE